MLDTKMDLVPSAEVILAVIDGRADIGNQRLPWSSGTFPQFDFGSLPFYFMDAMEYYNTLNDPEMQALLAREYDKIGLVYIADILFEPEGGIWANKPVAKVEDFQGLKIRTSGLLQTNTLKSLGASPLTIQVMELADAIARGTVDAAATSLMFGSGIGLIDVTSDVSIWLVTSTFPCAIVVNKDTFNALPPDLQEIVKEWGRVITKASVSAGWSHWITTQRWVGRVGIDVTVPEASEIARARALSKSSVDLWLEKAGPVGEEILAIASRYASGAQ